MDQPKLRKVERVPLERGDEALIVLRDPLGASEPMALDATYDEVLDRLDGQHSLAQIRQSLLLGSGTDLPEADLSDLVNELSAAGFLEDDAFRERWHQLAREFLGGPVRPPSLAGVAYPADPVALGVHLEHLLGDPENRIRAGSDVIGAVIPHLPFDLAREVLDPTLRDLPTADDLDLVVVLATDHHPGLVPFALTALPYETPLGVTNVDLQLVQRLERRLPWARREELRHRLADVAELGTVLLQYLYGEELPPVLPVLCGRSSLEERPEVDAFIDVMEMEVGRRRVLWLAAAELSHVGAAYGDREIPTDEARALDEDRLALLGAGRIEAFVRASTGGHVRARASGSAALSTLGRLLPVGYRQELVTYQQIRPPGSLEGAAGAAGLRLRRPG